MAALPSLATHLVEDLHDGLDLLGAHEQRAPGPLRLARARHHLPDRRDEVEDLYMCRCGGVCVCKGVGVCLPWNASLEAARDGRSRKLALGPMDRP